jgi:hypothetical protein
MGTPIDMIIRIIRDNSDNRLLCVQYAIICFAIQLKVPWFAFIVESVLDAIVAKFEFLLRDDEFFTRMSGWLKTEHPTGEMIVMKIRSLLQNDLSTNHNYRFGAVFYFKDGHFFLSTNPKNFNGYFGFVCDRMFPKQNVQDLESPIFKSRKILKELCVRFSDVAKVHSYTPPPQDTIESSEAPRSFAEIVAQNAVTFPLGAPQFVPAPLTRLLNAPVQSVHEPSVLASAPASLPESHPLMRRLDNTPVQVVHKSLMSLPVQHVHDTNELVYAVVNELFEEAFAKVIDKSAEAIGVRNQAALSRIFGEDPDANALREEVARQAIIAESAAFTDASAALEVKNLVKAAAEGGKSLFLDPPDLSLNSLARSIEPDIQPSSPGTVAIVDVPVSPTDYFPPASSEIPSLKNVPGNADSAALFAAMNSPIASLSGQPQFNHQNHANGDGGPFSVIQEEEDGADQSGTSPLPFDGKRQAPFPTLYLSSLQSVEIGASRAEPESSSSNLGSIPSSGPSGTTLTNELSDLLANLPILSLSSTPADYKQIVHSSEWTGIGVSPLAQSSRNQSGNMCQIPPQVPDLLKHNEEEEPPPFPLEFLLNHAKESGKGAHPSDIQSKNALSNVDVSRNPHADQPSFSPQGNGGPQVQVLASSGKPPGSFGGADHLETPSSSKLWSSCIPGRKTGSSTQPDNSSSSRHKFFPWRIKSNRVNPSQGQTNDTRPPVAHSPGTISSESAAATILPPSSSFPLGDNIGGSPLTAHPPGDPLVIAPSSAPSLSSELGSAATPNEKPPTSLGVKIGGIEPNGVRFIDKEFEFLVLTMKYSTAPWTGNPPLLWTHPCLPHVPNLERFASVA